MPVHDLVRSHLSCPVNPAFLQFTRQFIVHLVFAIQGALNRMVNWIVNRNQGSIESPYEDDAQPSELPGGPYRAVVFPYISVDRRKRILLNSERSPPKKLFTRQSTRQGRHIIKRSS